MKALSAKLDKSYPNCRVLTAATLEVEAGTVHALVGENGAGKSTLVKIVAGILAADAGTLAIAERPIELATWNRTAALAAHVGIVQQHGAFAGALSVVENAVLGAEPRRFGLLELGPTGAALAALGTKIGLAIDPWARVDTLSLGAAQRAEIVTALHFGAKLLLLDEPTAVLAPIEVEGLLRTLRELAIAGTTIVIVTHKLDEVREVADAVTVLRAGDSVARFTGALNVGEIARAMVGGELPAAATLASPTATTSVLELRGVSAGAMTSGAITSIDLAVRAGEIVGVAGVDGNGQRELALAIAGLVAHTGEVHVGGRDVSRGSPKARLTSGLAHVPEDRQHGGLVLDATIAVNLTLGRSDVTGRFRIDRAAVARFSDERIAELDIRPAHRDAIARSLSGGNQQKVVIGRELSRPQLAAVLAVQPTRGVDIGGIARIHDRLRAAARAGAGVLVISADLDELLGLCHRIVVMLRGRIVGERAGDALHGGDARAALGAMMFGEAKPASAS
ncbi:MAG: ATP-binding cassette domain-containing protein [Kofleriaceae bacterium]